MASKKVSTHLINYIGITSSLVVIVIALGIFFSVRYQLDNFTRQTQDTLSEFEAESRTQMLVQTEETKRVISAQIDQIALAKVQDAANQIESLVLRAGMIPRAIAARQMTQGLRRDREMVPFIANVLSLTPDREAFGATIAYDFVPWDSQLSMPWVDRNSFPNLNVVGYNYADGSWPWFTVPKQTRRQFISEPYFDAGGSNVTMLTISLPTYAENGELIGIATTDLALDAVADIVSGLKVNEDPVLRQSEYGILISSEGNIITHPNQSLMLRANDAGDGEVQGARIETLVDEAGPEIARAASGIAELGEDDNARRVYWATGPVTGLKVALNLPAPIVTPPSVALPEYSPPDTTAAIRFITLVALGLGLLGILTTLAIVYNVSKNIGRRIDELSRAAEQISKGQLNRPISVSGSDEIGQLANSFRRMQKSLMLLIKRQQQAARNQAVAE